MIRRSCLGFTLVELVVTMALVAILLFLAAPSFTAWVRNTEMRSVAEALQNGIRKAQSEAVTRNRQMVFSLTDDEPGVAASAAVAVADGRNWTVRSLELMDRTRYDEFVEGGSFGDTAANVTIEGPVSVCFNSQGRQVANASAGVGCDGTAAVFLITREGAERRLQVEVAAGGQIRMCDPDKAIATSPDGC